jgi:hypothetical protein
MAHGAGARSQGTAQELAASTSNDTHCQHSKQHPPLDPQNPSDSRPPLIPNPASGSAASAPTFWFAPLSGIVSPRVCRQISARDVCRERVPFNLRGCTVQKQRGKHVCWKTMNRGPRRLLQRYATSTLLASACRFIFIHEVPREVRCSKVDVSYRAGRKRIF